MNSSFVFAGAILATTLAAGPVLAQTPSVSSAAKPPVEIGIGLGAARIAEIDFVSTQPASPAADIRVTFPLTPRFAFESTLTVARDTTPFEHRTQGFYGFQIKQQIAAADTGRMRVFLTYGAAGSYRHVSAPARDIAVGKEAIRRPGYSYQETEPPLFAVFGAAFERELGRHIAVRVDAQAITVLWLPLAVRVSAGVSVPLGSYRRTSID